LKYELTEKEEQARKRVCLALDFPSVEKALDVAEDLSDLVGMVKVGMELHTAAGSEGISIVKKLRDSGVNVFLDLKYHDTPNTVRGAAYRATVAGANIFNLHIAGGKEMMKAAMDGASTAAADLGIERPKVIGVTVLTSLDDEDFGGIGYQGPVRELVLKRAKLAVECGLDGIVCAAKDVVEIKDSLPDSFLYVTPGIKAPISGIVREGQKRVITPGIAVQDCDSSYLVVGGAITKADPMRRAAYEVLQDMAKHL
jgi:orotidine-5'-phosphate decarboxylase